MNVGDSREAEVYVDRLIDERGCAVVGGTVTPCKMEAKIRSRYPQIGAPRPRENPRDRPHGRLALIEASPFAFRLLYRKAEKNFQIIIAQVREITYTVRYISPSAALRGPRGNEVEKCLNVLQTYSRGPSSAMGDWNARQRTWDKKSIPRGIFFKTGTERRGWLPRFSSNSTCFTYNGEE